LPGAGATGASDDVTSRPAQSANGADIVAGAVGTGKLFPMGSLAVCGVVLGVLASGCGGTQRDAHELKANYTVEVLHARFPSKQAIAHDTKLALIVRNAGAQTIPNVAVTIDSFYYTSTYPKLSSNKRPVWIVNTGPGVVPTRPVYTNEVNPPGGGETTFVNTWALGALAPHASKYFVWRVTPVKAGLHTVHYTVSAGLDGRGLARLAGGDPASGRFVAQVAPAPPATHVNPETGRVAAGPHSVPVAPQPAVP
jgi:hypothetical protein